jgi:hypothetical protein
MSSGPGSTESRALRTATEEVRMRGRRWATRVAALAIALAGIIGAGAAPAAAGDPPGGTLRGVYYDGQFCNSYGLEGAQTGRWSWYYCEYRQYNPNSPGLYFLWTFTY